MVKYCKELIYSLTYFSSYFLKRMFRNKYDREPYKPL